MDLPQTPNLKLQPIDPNRRVWADVMNENLSLIDATVGAYFAVQNLLGPWKNSTAYNQGDSVVDTDSSTVWQCQVAHTSAAIPSTFADERAAYSTYWTVYSSPARARGAWKPNTSYALNDFVVSGAQYAVAIQTHTSGSDFATDLAAGKWSVLVDLSSVGSQVLPVPGGAADANKVVITNTGGTGYTIITTSQYLTLLGATSIGRALLTAASGADALGAIGAQPAGSYQAASSNLTSLAAATLGAFGMTMLSTADAATARTALGLGTAATKDTGAGAGQIIVWDSGPKYPAGDGSQITNLSVSNGWSTGDVKLTLKATPDSGWVMFDDGTIGSATSGASNRANADTQALFYLLWAGFSDSLAPVTGGRGASKEADWTANKKIKLLTTLGRAIALAGSGSGLTARTLGDKVGEETHTLTSAEQASMSVSGSIPGGYVQDNISGNPTWASTGGNTTPLTVTGTAAGGGGAHNNMQPTVFLNAMVKL